MPFTIYPDAATSALLGTAVNTPVPLSAGVAMTNFAPLAAISGPDPTEFNLLTSFIRISMSDPGSLTPPQVALMAGNPAAGTTGAPQVIDPATNTSLTSGKDLADSSSMMNTPAASAYWSPPSYANNVYLLKVVLNRPNTSLAIKITNNTANPHDFVWVIADSDMNSQQPWMQLTPAMLVNEPPA